jgi:hypothetical protein
MMFRETDPFRSLGVKKQWFLFGSCRQEEAVSANARRRGFLDTMYESTQLTSNIARTYPVLELLLGSAD